MLLLCWLLPAAGASAAADGADDDRVVLLGPVLVEREETAGDIVVLDGDVTIRGAVSGDVVVVDGDITIRGTVAGDVVAISGLTTLGRRGRVGGDLVYGDERPVQAPGSRVAGEVKKFDVGDVSVIGAIAIWVALTASLLLLGLILLLLAPRAADAVARTGREKPGIAGLIGLVAFFLLPVIAFGALVSVIGLPLGIVLLLLIIPLYAIGYCAAGLVVGRLILKRATLLAFVVGILILQALALIPIAGGIVGFVATCLGLGTLLLAIVRARS